MQLARREDGLAPRADRCRNRVQGSAGAMSLDREREWLERVLCCGDVRGVAGSCSSNNCVLRVLAAKE